MSVVVLVKGGDGKLQGFGEKGQRSYGRFLAKVEALAIGETLQFEWREARSPKHHRLFFAKLHGLFERQEQFDSEDKLRAWLTVGAGYCAFVPGPKGRMVALPDSIAWVNLDETAFSDLHAKIDAFLWTDHAREFLWGHMTTQQTYDAVEQFMQEFNG